MRRPSRWRFHGTVELSGNKHSDMPTWSVGYPLRRREHAARDECERHLLKATSINGVTSSHGNTEIGSTDSYRRPKS
jgi:hypothetical protein